MAKMAREHARAISNIDAVSIGDHLYNFCVTSLAMRDHLLEHLGKLKDDERNEAIKSWEVPVEVIAAHEIGNSSKHLVLRDRPTKIPRRTVAQTVATAPTQREYVSANRDGSTKRTFVDSVQFSIVIGADEYDIWGFMSAVRDFWEARLEAEAIPFERLPHREYLPPTT